MLSARLAVLDSTRIGSAPLALAIRDEAVRLFAAERAVVWRCRPQLRQLFAEQAGEELRTLEISRQEARDVMREASVWVAQVVGIRRRLVEASFGVASGADPEPTLAIPLKTDVPHGLLLVRLKEWSGAGQLLLEAGPFASQAATLLANHDAWEGAQRNEAQLKALYETAGEISSKLELETVLTAIVGRARTLAEAPIAYLMLVDEASNEISMRVTSGIRSPTFSGIRLRLGAGLGGMVAQEKHPFYTSDYLNDAHFTHQAVVDDEVRREGIKSILGVPLKAFEKFVGVLYVADRALRTFKRAEIDVLMSLAHHAALAIENARLYERDTQALGQLEQANRVVQAHAQRLERAALVHRQLSEILLAGEGLTGVVRLMAELVGEPAVVLDEHARVLAAAGSPADPFGRRLAAAGLDEPASLEADVRRARAGLGELAASELPARPPDRLHARLVVPIVAGAELLGSVWVETRPEAAEEERHLIEQAVRVVGLELLKERSLIEAERRMRRELLDELLAERASNDVLLARRAAVVGVDLGRSHRLVVASIRPLDDPGPARGYTVEPATERLVGALRAQSWCAFAGERAGRVVALVAAHLSSLESELRHVLEDTGSPNFDVRAVISSACTAPADYRAEFVAADRVLRVLPDRIPEPVVDLDLVRFLPLLFREGGEDELRRFSLSRLGLLLRLREPQRRELLRTLSAYFESGTSPARTAASLHVHVNTVYYRLERLRTLLGSDFAEPLRALDLQIALLAQRLTDASLVEPPKAMPEISESSAVDRRPVGA